MKFDRENLVDIESLSLDEAKIFLAFLRIEQQRHREAGEAGQTWIAFWTSEMIRQQKEVEHIDRGIKQTKERFGL